MTWTGRQAMNARAHWRPLVEVGEIRCWRCNRRITPDPTRPAQGWHVGHIIDRALGGDTGHTNQWPEHDRCNLAAGGRLGAAITNARRQADTPAPTMLPERARNIRPRF